MEYQPWEIEKNWLAYWKKHEIYKVENDTTKPKFYVLDMFPYPSGSGLHVGHPLGYIASDIFSRYKRMKGFNVLHPMGFDAFGLPAEQYAIQTGKHPAQTTKENIARYKEQLENIGFCYDWSREVTTSDPKFYRWTQWIFMQLFNAWYDKKANKAKHIDELMATFKSEGNVNIEAATSNELTFHAETWNALSEKEQQQILMQYRLAYQGFSDVNWCEELGTVLANDEVVNGVSVRGGYPVVKRPMRQWFLRITAYAQRLLEGLNEVDFPESLKDMQRNWIGRSEGASLRFKIASPQPSPTEREQDRLPSNDTHSIAGGKVLPEGEDLGGAIEVFTTRPDTIFGATFLVLAPEHSLVKALTTPEQEKDISDYITYVKSRSERERQSEVKVVSGAFTGSYVLNPFNDEKVPVWIGEYVLMGYGTGAIMAVPADDARDKAFAEKFNLPIVDIIDKSMYPGATIEDKVGKMINSHFLNGMEVKEAIKKVIDLIEEKGIGTRKVNYRMRDAGFSRQRYWGEPFPVHYKEGNPYLLDESALPVELPVLKEFKPTGTGESPLSTAKDWVQLSDGTLRETDTMPGYAGSSWYFLRYMDPHNETGFVSKEAQAYWKDVDLYIGGAEHAVGHLLYSRFWHKFFYDRGWVETHEPYRKLVNQGMIQGRSSFVYMLPPLFYVRDKHSNEVVSVPMKKSPIIFINSNFIDDNPQLSINSLDNKWIKPLREIVNKYLKDKSEIFEFNTSEELLIETTLIPIHTDVYIVNNDELDREKFRVMYPDYKDAVFILEDENGNPVLEGEGKGSYICGWEIEKMSKSKYNVVNPDDIIDEYGADTFRMYEMFLGPIEQSKPWNTNGIDGVYKFVKRLWRLFYDDKGVLLLSNDEPTKADLKVLHKTIKKVTEDIERFNFNTCISTFMICVNELKDLNCNKRSVLEPLVLLLAPFAPFIAEELWQNVLLKKGSVHKAEFPAFNAAYLVEDSFEYPVSVNGKLRTKIEMPTKATQAEVEPVVLANEIIQKWLEGNAPKKIVFVPGRMVNVVI
jgi:leucyl-tRNA synthetase